MVSFTRLNDARKQLLDHFHKSAGHPVVDVGILSHHQKKHTDQLMVVLSRELTMQETRTAPRAVDGIIVNYRVGSEDEVRFGV